jgi:D-alanine-D-alanine ligase
MKIAVLFGGTSMERDVSVASASQVVAALRTRGHDVVAVDAERGALARDDEGRWLNANVARRPPEQRADEGFLRLLEFAELRVVDVVFLALHGGDGENGALQALLELAGIPYTGTGQLSSAMAMDKDISKRLCRVADVPTPDWLMAPVPSTAAADTLGLPLIVKPNSQGSTVGLSLVREAAAIPDAIALAKRFDREVMLERFIDGRELTVGILADRALAVGEIVLPGRSEIFDYEAKYQVGGAAEIFPADVSNEVAEAARTLALRAARALKIEDYCRVDFRLDGIGNLWFLEVNTLPGLTSASLLPRSAAAVGIEFPVLCERICELALARRACAA